MTRFAIRESVSTETPIPEAEEIRVRGTVQGVGFRPTVYRLAIAGNLRGEVLNDGDGVLIRLVGGQDSRDRFVQQLQAECPPLARIEAIVRTPLTESVDYERFTIASSVHSGVHTAIVPDAATCPECLADTLDPFSRWYRYPFTNCTHCGPRLSIVRTIPYDRRNTSMATFPLCPQCAEHYGDVTDRRFHAQPIACHICGPRAWLERSDGKPIVADMFSMMDDVDAACTVVQRGDILAIKGVGGIHLACDATQEATVQRLRQRKHRYNKPFALMARDLGIIERYCWVSPEERALLQSPAAPIVLLQLRSNATVPAIAPSVAPGLTTLGFMLPYTPLHHLMLRRMNRPIVLTSGNRSDEPQCIDNDAAREKLGSIADFLLLHNRDIVNRVDDSVVRVRDQQVQILRRARGYAPAPIQLPGGFEAAPPLLAMGSELKNTFCLVQRGQAIVSQHLGDLENASALQAYRETLKLYLKLFEHQPATIALDHHPEYLSTKLGWQLGEGLGVPVEPIQHHHAHVASCMAENGVPLEAPPVLGIALDGLGYGEDGTLWGGEFLLSSYPQFQRLGRLQPIALLGGSQAIYQPWRNTYAHLMAGFDWDQVMADYGHLGILQFLHRQPRSLLNQLLEKGINAPLASSAGRLFDGVAAALGLNCDRVSYEGQAAIRLEALIQPEDLDLAQSSPYSFSLEGGDHIPTLNARPLWQALLEDLHRGTAPGLIAARFHVGFARSIVQMVHHLRQSHSFTQVALTGGVFQNAILTSQVRQRLTEDFTVLLHHQVPANDGGLSLGQAAIAAARRLQSQPPSPSSRG